MAKSKLDMFKVPPGEYRITIIGSNGGLFHFTRIKKPQINDPRRVNVRRPGSGCPFCEAEKKT